MKYIVLMMGDRTMDHGKFPVYAHKIVDRLEGAEKAAIQQAKKMLREDIAEDHSLNNIPYEITWEMDKAGVCTTVSSAVDGQECSFYGLIFPL